MSSKARAMPAAKNGLESTGTGRTEVHPDGCDCRRCRRTRAAQARRKTPRYGQQRSTLPSGTPMDRITVRRDDT